VAEAPTLEWVEAALAYLESVPQRVRLPLAEEFAHYVTPDHLLDCDLVGPQEPHVMEAGRPPEHNDQQQDMNPDRQAGTTEPEGSQQPDGAQEPNDRHHEGALVSPEALLGAAESGLRCARCKSTSVIQVSEQHRAGDEAQSWFYQCRQCGKCWKMS